MQTDSKNNIKNTSVSVLMINAQGIMLSVLGNDYFISYNRIPWMQDAPVRSVLNVQMSGTRAIEWPDLDVDLEIESLQHPERYPLVMKRNPLDYVNASYLYIDIELLALVLCTRIPPIIRTKEHADGSSRLIGVDSSLLVSCRSLGGNQSANKHRMVPPFLFS